MQDREVKTEETSRKAGFNMMKFVATIFVIAMVLAAVWFFLLTPEVPN